MTPLPERQRPAAALERVSGWLVAGTFFAEEGLAREEQQRLDLFAYCEDKFGREGSRIARAVWEQYTVTRRVGNRTDK